MSNFEKVFWKVAAVALLMMGVSGALRLIVLMWEL